MALYFISLRLLMPFLKIELAMLFFYNGLAIAATKKVSVTSTEERGYLSGHAAKVRQKSI